MFVSVIVVSLDGLLQTPEGMALKHALVCMLFAFGHFTCWFGLRCTLSCGSPLVAQTKSASGCGKKFPVSMDVFVQHPKLGTKQSILMRDSFMRDLFTEVKLLSAWD